MNGGDEESERDETRTLERAGSTVHYWLAGPADGPLVACTHGASMDHRLFEPQVEPLANAGYRVLTWDVRGHGRSKPIGEPFTVPAVADDLLALLDELDAERTVLLGQSFGGYISQEVTYRHPERVAALGIVGSTDLLDRPPLLEYLALRLSPYLFRVWPDGHLRKLIAERTAHTDPVREYAFDATRQLSKREFLTVWDAVATCHRSDPAYRIERPLLLTHGGHDGTGTIARDAPAWAAREPNCRYEVIPDAGHNANQDNPDYFNRVLLEFLDGISLEA
ncbi:alpha/beta fold hydrolase [Natronobiforma cellulositropha]|uniref:alpha/beta fold hydrolase n=1 Tax=Natronobiforma cellulositropha TaxID=1679076 RepID=UPI0021D60EE5|nr:alpha/beta hydrolase [Natronobiforma cellulositropha]